MGSVFMNPDGWTGKQISPEHPSQTYEMFSAETLNEAARPMSLGLNVAKCDSSRYNFAGGRLDIITSWKAVEVNQSNNTWRVVNPLFRAWYAEARMVYGWKTRDDGKIPDHQFYWVGMPYSDPEAEQAADESAITTGLKGIQEIYARRGRDWNNQAKANARALGMAKDKYMEWVQANLTRAKGGTGGDTGTEKQPRQTGGDRSAGEVQQ
jgi:capsid protein